MATKTSAIKKTMMSPMEREEYVLPQDQSDRALVADDCFVVVIGGFP